MKHREMKRQSDINKIEIDLREDKCTVEYALPEHDLGTGIYTEEFVWSATHPPDYLKKAAAQFVMALNRAVSERANAQRDVPCKTCTGNCCGRHFSTVRVTKADIAVMHVVGKVLVAEAVELWDGHCWPKFETTEELDDVLSTLPESIDGTVGYMKMVPWKGHQEEEGEQQACMFLQKDGCAIYEGRPQVCRDYSAWTCDIYEEDPDKVSGKVRLRVLP